jgi:hypothetical protein
VVTPRANNDERSLGDLFSDLARESSMLIRQEVKLAKTELTQSTSRVGKSVGVMAAGGAIAYAGLLAIMAAVVIVLEAAGLPWWLSALVVGLVAAGAGYFLIQKGREELKQANLAPRQTMETLREDTQWAKEQLR